MKSFLAFTFASALCLTMWGCTKSDTRKLTDDAKATGKAVGQTASDALDATKKAVDTAGDDAKKAANSDTAKDIEEKTKRAAQQVADKTKEAAQKAKDSLDKDKPVKP